MLDLISFGSIAFYLILIIPFSFLTYYGHKEHVIEETFALILTIAGVIIFTNVHIMNVIHHINYWAVAEDTGLYLVVGFVYMIIRWIYYSFEVKIKYSKLRSQWLEKNKQTAIPLETSNSTLYDQFIKYLSFEGSISIKDLPPKMHNNKSKLFFWLVYFPFSITGLILNDPLRKLFNLVIYLSAKPMNRISKWIFSEFEELK